jgi:hypothetical protein
MRSTANICDVEPVRGSKNNAARPTILGFGGASYERLRLIILHFSTRGREAGKFIAASLTLRHAQIKGHVRGQSQQIARAILRITQQCQPIAARC